MESEEPDLIIGSIQDNCLFSDEETWWHGFTTEGNLGRTVEFNSAKKGWNYAWASHKSHANSLHAFKVYICEYWSETSVKVVGIAQSPGFQLCSRNSKIFKIDSLKRKHVSEEGVLKQIKTGLTSGFKYVLESLGAEDPPPSPHACIPICEEEKFNRTLDRLYAFLTQAEFHEGKCKSKLVDVFQKMTLSKSDPFTKIYRHFMELVELDGNSSNICTDKWLESTDARTLMKLCASERDRTFTWKPSMEDETYDENAGSEKSIFASFRHAQRQTVLRTLAISSLDVDYLHDVMEIASNTGLLSMDPFHPPSIEDASTLHLQVYHHPLSDFSKYSAGQSTFSSNAVHELYARDLLLMRRSQYQSTVLACLRKNQLRISGLMDAEPADERIDISGVWIDTASYSGSWNYPGFPGLIGHLYKAFVSRMLRHSLRKVRVCVTKNMFMFTAQRIFLGEISQHYIMDEKVRLVECTQPVSFLSKFMRGQDLRRYVVFLDLEQRDILLCVDTRLVVPQSIMSTYNSPHTKKYPASEYSLYRILKFHNSDSMDEVLVTMFDVVIPRNHKVGFDAAIMKDIYYSRRYMLPPDPSIPYARNSLNSLEEDRYGDLLSL